MKNQIVLKDSLGNDNSFDNPMKELSRVKAYVKATSEEGSEPSKMGAYWKEYLDALIESIDAKAKYLFIESESGEVIDFSCHRYPLTPMDDVSVITYVFDKSKAEYIRQ